MISINLFFLRKFVYLDGYMDDCKKFNETTLPKKEEFYSHLKYGRYYVHARKVYKDFEIKNLGEYNDLHLKSGTLFLADVFENWENVFKNLAFRSCKISFSSWISVASSF